MKTLESIQKISNIGKILSKICFVCCIVGAALSACGILSFAFFNESLKVGGVTVKSMVEKSADTSVGDTYAMLISALAFCIAYAIVSKIANKYFVNELKAGTPFTFDGSKQLFNLGLFVICAPSVAAIVVQIAIAVLKHFYSGITEDAFETIPNLITGLVIIVISLICKYGAEILEEKKNNTEISDENTCI